MPWPFQFFRYKSGTPLHHLKAADLQFIFNFFNTVDFIGGRIEKTANGIGWKWIASNPKQITAPEPWDIYTLTGTTVRINPYSYVELHHDGGTTYGSPIGAEAQTAALTDNETNVIYVEVKPNMTSQTLTCTIKRTGGIGGVLSNATTYCKALWEIYVRDGTPEIVRRYHRGNVEFYGWRGY